MVSSGGEGEEGKKRAKREGKEGWEDRVDQLGFRRGNPRAIGGKEIERWGSV